MIIENSPLIEHIFENDVIIVPMGINNSFSSKFLREISINFPEIINADAKTPYGDKRKYGTIVECETENLIFCLSYVSNGGYQKHKNNGSIIDLDSLISCLKKIFQRHSGKKIAFPLIYGIENDAIVNIINDNLNDCVIYKYNQRDFDLEMFRKIAEIRKKAKDKEISSEEYTRLRSEIEWRRKNGIYKPVPEGYVYIPKQQYRNNIIKPK